MEPLELSPNAEEVLRYMARAEEETGKAVYFETAIRDLKMDGRTFGEALEELINRKFIDLEPGMAASVEGRAE